MIDMGFNNWPAGEDLYNIINDIPSAQVVFHSNVPVVVGCADVCRESLSVDFAEAKTLISSRGPIGNWLGKSLPLTIFASSSRSGSTTSPTRR